MAYSGINSAYLRMEPMADDHKHGSMDISDQEKTFEGFMNFTIRSVLVILVAVIFLALVGA